MELGGKWALVTGAARRIGKATAVSLAAAGANVVVHYGRSADQAEETAGEVHALGVEALTLTADLAQPREIESLFTEIERRCGALSVLINNAASFERQAFDEIVVADWDDVLAVNLRAPFLCVQHAARLMQTSDREAEAGVIVNIGDLSGLQAWPRFAHHGVSKAGLVHLTKIAARELAPSIRVNCVVPGAILPPPGGSTDDPAWRAKGARVPLCRTGDPALVTEAIQFLIANSFVTGVVLPVDGGEHLTGAEPVPI